MEKKRKRKNDLVNKQRLTPGSGNVWKRKQLKNQKQYNQYDYKNHEYMKTIGNKTLTVIIFCVIHSLYSPHYQQRTLS